MKYAIFDIFLKMGSNQPVDGPTGLILPPIDLSREMHSKNIQFVGVSDEPRITATNRDNFSRLHNGTELLNNDLNFFHGAARARSKSENFR